MTYLNQENQRLKFLTREIIQARNETEIFFLDVLNEKGIGLSICGELASVKPVVRRLYRVGIKNFSVSCASARALNDALLNELEE